ncbi:hypothetical protein FVB9288_00145 [Flavobacterium sp. CECT 9288]|uniref:hypothetical protein n=1 Tax=Flavobacterium sp. CECT 9288 TaxID=2845819 RepID=UPI001E518CFA|nr:hypothetical protein [Flavobacterium sp. CECT 9288]CAH0334557.1 hypothetical protein FVB9288_00145 [Flavobacterium sp. CECT 9288]
MEFRILNYRMHKSTKIKIYFYSILSLSIIWLFIFPKPIKNFAPIVFVIPTFPVFALNSYNGVYKFSSALKEIHLDLFRKYVIDYGNIYDRGKIVDIGFITKNEDFENLQDANLYEMYKLCKQFMRLAIYSFVIFGLLGIATVYL